MSTFKVFGPELGETFDISVNQPGLQDSVSVEDFGQMRQSTCA